MTGILITFLAGISIAVGAAITRAVKNTEIIEHVSIALAMGAMLSLLIFDLFPDIREFSGGYSLLDAALLIAGGILVLRVLDMFIPDHEDTEETHDRENAVHIGLISALAIMLHNIVEGMTVYSMTLVSLRSGIIFALAISMHNIPMGMLIWTTLEGSSRRRKRAVLLTVTLSTLVGGIIMQVLAGAVTARITGGLVCIASGMILYIEFAELIPHVFRTKSRGLSAGCAAAGFALVWASCLIG
jgi:ZIP family zinc transporter